MDESQWLAERFQEHRGHLRAVAYRMLGSISEADDAVQETWLRLSRTGADGIGNLGGWLTTVTGRVCLDMLRTRGSRREEPLDAHEPPVDGPQPDPEEEALLADSVGVALLVVLDSLTPAERLAFVLHDTFGVPFDEIGPIVGRSPDAAKMLASRARRRVREASAAPGAGPARQRELVEAFLAAAREGDFEALLKVLDPDAMARADAAAAMGGTGPAQVRGASAVARQALAFRHRARHARVALVDGSPALVVTVNERAVAALTFTFARNLIAGVDVIGDPDTLGAIASGTRPDPAGRQPEM